MAFLTKVLGTRVHLICDPQESCKNLAKAVFLAFLSTEPKKRM